MKSSYDDFLNELVASYGNWFEDEQKLKQGRMTKELYPYTLLFSPIQVNSIKIKNRIVMGPMGNISMAEETGRPSTKMIQYFTERAKGGAGLITSGLVHVSQRVDPTVTELGELSYFPRIDRSRTVFSGWRILAENIHAHGARFFIQLSAGMGRVGSPECLVKKFKLPVSSSWNPNFYMPKVPCRPLSGRKCKKIIRRAGQAAADAKAMLIDGVYLHGHEGYLLEQMTNTAFNRRKLRPFSGWQAFGIELVKEIRRRCGNDYPIIYRIDLSLALKASFGQRMDRVSSLRKFRRERTIEMTLDYMKNLVKAGVDMFDVDLGCYENWWLPHPPSSMPPGCFLPVAKLVKDYFVQSNIRSNTGLPVPVVAVGKLNYPDLAEAALRDGMCDMIMLARPLLADPYWPQKAFSGRTSEIVPCIGDQEACINEFIHGGHLQCAVNPRAGFEDVMEAEPAMASRLKKVAVVGAGPAGVICACTAAKRGHEVTIFERFERAGGCLIPGMALKIKFDLANYVDYLNSELQRTAEKYPLIIKFKTEMTAEALKQGKFEAVVISVGAKPFSLPIEGVNLPHVVQAIDLFRNPSLADKANKVVVIGGGLGGCEAAYFLSWEKGKEVIVIEMLPYFMKDLCTANRGYLIHFLEQKGVKLLNCARLKAVDEKGVLVIRNVSPTVPDPYVTWEPVLPENIENPLAKPIRVKEEEMRLEADLVVLAAGYVPDDNLYEQCFRERVSPEIYNIGDSFSPGNVFEAVKAGYAIGRTL